MNKYILSIITISILLLTGNTLLAIEQSQKPQDTRFLMQLDNVSKSYSKLYGIKGNKLQAVPEFVILDSLANGYSYYTSDQTPFMYYPETNTLVTIKRGYSESDNGTTTDPTNSKNNLFILESNDMGHVWSSPILVYDKNTVNLGDARYPSIFPFMYDGELSYGYMASVSTGSDWQGFIQGFYSKTWSWLADKFYQFEDERNDSYVFETTSNYIMSYEDNSSFYLYSVSTPMPPTGTNDLNRQNSFAYVKSQDMESAKDWKANVPDQWNSDLFQPITYADANSYKSKTTTMIGLDKRDGDKWYMAAAGIFKAGEDNNRSRPGVSTSEDNGITWTDFNVFPNSLLRQYATNNGCYADSSSLYYYIWAYNTYGKDSYSFMGYFSGRDSKGIVVKNQILELNYENSTWTVIKIADQPTYGYLLYLPATGETSGTNQMNWEFQLSKTIDNSTLIAKWVAFYDIMDTKADTVIKAGAQDVFVATRKTSDDTWSKQINVTNTNDYDRITWIPNLVPNDLKDIPLLKLWTICDPSKLSADEYTSQQRNLELPQYVLMTHFNADPISKVDNDINYGFNFNGIFPNPANDHIEITMSINKYDFYTIDIYDVLGNKIINVFTGYQTAGLKSLVYNTDKLNSGTYFCVITSSNGNLTKSFNVVK